MSWCRPPGGGGVTFLHLQHMQGKCGYKRCCPTVGGCTLPFRPLFWSLGILVVPRRVCVRGLASVCPPGLCSTGSDSVLVLRLKCCESTLVGASWLWKRSTLTFPLPAWLAAALFEGVKGAVRTPHRSEPLRWKKVHRSRACSKSPSAEAPQVHVAPVVV